MLLVQSIKAASGKTGNPFTGKKKKRVKFTE